VVDLSSYRACCCCACHHSRHLAAYRANGSGGREAQKVALWIASEAYLPACECCPARGRDRGSFKPACKSSSSRYIGSRSPTSGLPSCREIDSFPKQTSTREYCAPWALVPARMAGIIIQANTWTSSHNFACAGWSAEQITQIEAACAIGRVVGNRPAPPRLVAVPRACYKYLFKRDSYSGSTRPCQGRGEGSIPLSRSSLRVSDGR
jgi:hypothetical protein